MIQYAICLILISAGVGNDDGWTSFRNGGPSRSDAETLPLRWSAEEGIAWQRGLGGYGQSSPIVWRETVFVTLVGGPKNDKCVVLALDARSGQTRWKKEFAVGTTKASDPEASLAASTPVVDADGVYALLDGGNLVSLDHEGNIKWERSLTDEYGTFDNPRGMGSSLTQTADAVMVLVDHVGPSYLLAVDKTTGKNKWKADRESRNSWTTPIVTQRCGIEQIVVSSNGSVDGYDAGSGKLLWTVGGVTGNTIPSPAMLGGRIFIGATRTEFATTSKSEDVQSCCLGLRELDGRLNCEVLWRAKKVLSFYSSPLAYGQCVYHVSKTGVLYCLDIKTGETHYMKRIGGPCRATPVAAGKHVYFFRKDGATAIVEAGPEFTAVTRNTLWDLKNPPKSERHRYKERQTVEKLVVVDNITEVMKMYDEDADGELSWHEGPPSLRKYFGRKDVDRDGIIEREIILAWIEEEKRRGRSVTTGRHVESSVTTRRSGSRRDSRSSRGSRGSRNDESDESSSGPTVYGVAVAGNSFYIRTGTRLYCVRGSSSAPSQ